jgi:flagellar biosynthesis protein FlhB
MPDYAGEKTLEPTPHRRQQARREGHVAKSHDLGSAAMLLLGLGALVTLGGGLVGFMVEYCRSQLGGEPWLTADTDFVIGQWNATLWAVGRHVLPILGLLCLGAVAVNVLQVGFLFLPQRLALDFARLDPLAGLRRIFSAAGAVRLGFGVVKLLVISAVVCAALWGQGTKMLTLTALTPAGIAAEMVQILFWIGLKVGAALLVVALLDYAYQWWRHEQDLKMTPQELREELRNLEGNPQMTGRRKQMRQELTLKRQRE